MFRGIVGVSVCVGWDGMEDGGWKGASELWGVYVVYMPGETVVYLT